MTRGKALSEEDLRLWAAYGRTVRLLPGRGALPVPPEPKAATVVVAAPADVVVKVRGGRAPEVGLAPAGLDRASWRKFRVGQIRPARVLDLHGLTAAHAHRATIQFLQAAQAQGQRCVEIVTGKGAILARELPLWLDAPPLRGLILALAYPHAANTGALRLLLRRRRD